MFNLRGGARRSPPPQASGARGVEPVMDRLQRRSPLRAPSFPGSNNPARASKASTPRTGYNPSPCSPHARAPSSSSANQLPLPWAVNNSGCTVPVAVAPLVVRALTMCVCARRPETTKGQRQTARAASYPGSGYVTSREPEREGGFRATQGGAAARPRGHTACLALDG